MDRNIAAVTRASNIVAHYAAATDTFAAAVTPIVAQPVSMFEKSVSKMRLSDLLKATNNFNKNPLMVRRLQDSQHSEKEFVSEMAALGSVKHPNLVRLLGFCVANKERLLVFKYMSNDTLHDHIRIADESRKPMGWPLRLHHNCNPRIIHQNISYKCILMDADFEPKTSDFGLGRLVNPIDTHLSTFVNGEFGDLGLCFSGVYKNPKGMSTALEPCFLSW
ncbi:PREDICTED: probably inactive leucine-rich repeat receptor-like protein kinase At5g48380 [Populus euphratica]|uniref:Probably inactive leucine-rich repeat receptor-like protein kinase At5g48380 n=1 Tax=Populus euphratica TaxID=75702 RepID=A0AAJ6TG87_POPEU|nr:PREDICTED: probably inactive leucine-rich repeat receptor-like protein kinase At5g48380 [Populus euphratica]